MSGFKEIGLALAKIGAPLLGGLVGGPPGVMAGKVAIDIVASALGVENEPAAMAMAIAADPEAAAKIRTAELANTTRLAELRAETVMTEIREANMTYRTELQSEDQFVRRMRPTFGYIVAASWAGVFGTFAYRLATAQAADIMVMASAISLMLPLFAMALTVLGIYISKRSDEKAVGAGHPPTPGIMAALASRVMGSPK